jgi:16S rRNA (adenine1518-N6/adenine1519-N6)-dimethyltransferase
VERAPLRELLQRHGLALSRERGQNFLLGAKRSDELAELAGVGASDFVLEIGTGLGALTRALAARARRVLSIEIDSGLVRALRAEQLLPANVELLHADALSLDFAALLGAEPAPRRLVANLPYSASAPLLRAILDVAPALADWSVMVQREVAQRLLASPGERDYGSLSVLFSLVARAERSRDLAPHCFYPAPEVHSSFLRCTPRGDSPLAPGELPAVERVVRAAFGTRRKTLANALAIGLAPKISAERIAAAAARVGVDPRARAETLAPELLLDLSRALAPAAV